jgi:VanZ family protein
VPRRLAPFSVLLVMVLIFVASSQPKSSPRDLLWYLPGQVQNLLHLPVYAVFSAAWCLALPRWREWRTALLIVLLCVVFGLSDEWHQSFVPGRQADVFDVLRDAIGACIGLIVMRCLPLAPGAPARDPGLDRH